MNKKMKICLSLCLTLVMLASMLAFPASAATEENVKTYQGVCCIGDSTSAGYGVANLDYSEGNNWWGWGGPKAHYGVADEAFPGIIRNIVCEDPENDYYSMTCVGQRIVDALWILGDYEDEYDKEEAYNYHYVHQNSQTRWQAMERMHDTGEGIANVQSASLILINIGANDAFTYPKNSSIIDGELNTELLLERLAEGFMRYTILYPRMIERVIELNPNAEIVLVGQYNPYKNISIREGDGTIGKILDGYIRDMNAKAKACAALYNCTYVDVTEVGNSFKSISITEDDFLNKFNNMDNHPDAEGHQYIAKQILAALPEAERSVSQPNSGIDRMELNGADMGSYIFRASGSGWTIKTLDGKYVCYDSATGKVVLRATDPTVWTYSNGFSTVTDKVTHYTPLFQIPYTTGGKKVYLSSADGSFTTATRAATTKLYVAN